MAEEPTDPTGGTGPERPEIRTLSRRATRLFVIAAVVLAFAIAIASAVYLVRTAREAQEEISPEPPTEELVPPDGAPEVATPPDTTSPG